MNERTHRWLVHKTSGWFHTTQGCLYKFSLYIKPRVNVGPNLDTSLDWTLRTSETSGSSSVDMFTAGLDLGAFLFFSTNILNNFCFCGADVAVELPELFCARKDTAFPEIDLLGRATDFRFDLENGGISFFVCKIGLVVCRSSAVGVAPRFGAALRVTNNQKPKTKNQKPKTKNPDVTETKKRHTNGAKSGNHDCLLFGSA